MSRVALSQIRSLTFYNGEQTLSRRGQPVPQLKCIGKPCKLYQPEAVRCSSLGGSGTDVDWQCDADLPDSLRFGKVEVSCEGWDGPGDPYVLKGSCGLEYRLVQVPNSLRGQEDPRFPSRWLSSLAEDPVGSFFILLWIFGLGLIFYHLIKSCFGSRSRDNPRSTPRPPPRTPGYGSGWFSGGAPGLDNNDPPPPYTKHPSTSAQTSAWNPGFWTGAAVGGLGAMLLNNSRQERRSPRMYDWETERILRPAPASSSWFGGSPGRRATDRGEGPSDLGRMRRSTGLGGSNVR